MPEPIIFKADSERNFYSTILEDLLLSIKETLLQKSVCVIGLCGGNTPENLYKLLANEKLDWEKIIFITIDERFVPSDSTESNLRMIRRSITSRIQIPPENIISFDTSLPLESAAKEMHRKLEILSQGNFLNSAANLELIDILILGVGDDGHIASIFENSPPADTEALATVSKALGYKTEDRLTLTMRALLSARKTLIHLKGEKKGEIFEEIKCGKSKHAALNKILKQDFVKVYFLV